ncbi:hypothetical protein [Thermoactinomyces sp. DSM 45892]|uniref:hypothetical protein n=1 Tax=Thermoactinomyces sp. DSM 45892 TaxID=1882753 RepID=UPI0008993579|nr:hypothetical protein [Thermoactinomyces sp. DSM 45892]SDY30706.1 hypothetical protein SAMN05444416_103232 [Thermoactinomyces sp. DSM 45892]
MTARFENGMAQWEHDVDNIHWKSILHEIDEALADNLAAEIGFSSFERLEHASELVAGEYHICHLSDGRWAWWNVEMYVTEDPLFFQSKIELIQYIQQFLQLDSKQLKRLDEGLGQAFQMKRCLYCEYEYDPQDADHWDPEQEQPAYCSATCATSSVLEEMKDGL